MSNFIEIGSERPVKIYESTHLTISVIVSPKNILDNPVSYNPVPAALFLQAKSGYAVNVASLSIQGAASGNNAANFVQFWTSTGTDTRPVNVTNTVDTTGQRISLDWVWRSANAPANSSTNGQVSVSHIQYSLAATPPPAPSGKATTVTEIDVLAPPL